MQTQSELTTIILAFIVILPSLASAYFGYLSLQASKSNTAKIAEVADKQAELQKMVQ
jgi:hypothetical protein